MRMITALVAGLVVAQLATFATTVYLHRGIAHRALSLDRRAALVLRVLLWITTGIKPREWAAVHRLHHAATDTERDPHSPLQLGFWKVQLGNVVLYRRALRDGSLVARYARDIPRDRLDALLLDRAWLGLALGIAILVLSFGWSTGLAAAGIHTAAYLGLNAAVNAVGHSFGRRRYDNTATNNQWLAWLTAGEGLHNNHHAAPTSARLALRSGEVDPGWLVVRMLVAARLAEVRHQEARIRQAAA